MNWLRWILRLPSKPALLPAMPSHAVPLEADVQASALAAIERKLDILILGGDPGRRISDRAELEVHRFFGAPAVHRIRSVAEAAENGATVVAADRLLVTFLGRSAAMAITRKLYFGPK